MRTLLSAATEDKLDLDAEGNADDKEMKEMNDKIMIDKHVQMQMQVQEQYEGQEVVNNKKDATVYPLNTNSRAAGG